MFTITPLTILGMLLVYAVLFFVIFHAAAGVRVMLTDLGLAERWHRSLVWVLAVIALIIFLYFALRYA